MSTSSMDRSAPSERGLRTRAARRERLRILRELVASGAVANQHELVGLLSARGHDVSQATVSRDIADLGLVKVSDHGRHVYAAPDALAPLSTSRSDARLRRVLADYPITIGRSGLTLLLVSEAGSAGAIGQAIDESTLDEQEGTLAGDNTILVLFADDARLDAWMERFGELLPASPLTE